LRRFDPLLKGVFFPFFPPHFPDHALCPKFAVEGRVGAGYALIQALAAISGLMFLAGDNRVAIRMISTVHNWLSVTIPASSQPEPGPQTGKQWQIPGEKYR
jgi:hypothetical protein